MCTVTPSSPPQDAASPRSSVFRVAVRRRTSPPRWVVARKTAYKWSVSAGWPRARPACRDRMASRCRSESPARVPARLERRIERLRRRRKLGPARIASAAAHGPFDRDTACSTGSASTASAGWNSADRAGDPPPLRAPQARRPAPHGRQEAWAASPQAAAGASTAVLVATAITATAALATLTSMSVAFDDQAPGGDRLQPEVLADERACHHVSPSGSGLAPGSPERGVTVRAVLTDNGPDFLAAPRSRARAIASRRAPSAAHGPTTPRPTARSTRFTTVPSSRSRAPMSRVYRSEAARTAALASSVLHDATIDHRRGLVALEAADDLRVEPCHQGASRKITASSC